MLPSPYDVTAPANGTAVRVAGWVGALDGLFARRPDLVGVHALADLTRDAVRASA